MSITLTQGMRANLYALQSTSDLMELTQKRLSTGKRVNTALDDPVNFFRSKEHLDRASDLSAKKDGMNESIKVIEAANTGIEGIYDLLAQMKSIAQAAKTSSNPSALETQYNTLISQIATLASDSSYGGTNLLGGESLSVEFNEDGSNTLSVAGTTATTSGSVAGVAVAGADFSDNTAIAGNISDIDDAVSALRVQAQSLASNLSTISIRADFTDKMVNTLESGADNLTLADMNEEGANMLMLQTRQALGTTSLSLSSQAAQSVLRLF
jgi:flagellin-like hook-associated protein FlgL